MLKYGFIVFVLWYLWSRKAKIPKVVNYLLAALLVMYAGIAVHTLVQYLH